jgi:hypothetical protein
MCYTSRKTSSKTSLESEKSERRGNTVTVHQRPRDETHPAASSTTPGRKKWNWYRVAQVAWIVLALGMLANFVVSLPTY